VTLVIGLAVAALSALATDIGFLLRHRGATEAPDVDIRTPIRTIAALFSKKWWSIGFAVALVAWIFHVTALKLAPLSLVQAVLAGGFVLLGILAERFFGFKVGRREWIGIGLTAVGLALLGVTAGETATGNTHSSYGLTAAIAFEGGLVLVGLLAMIGHRHPRVRGQAAPLLAAGAGLLFTVSHIAIKALTKQLHLSDPTTLLTPWIPLLLFAFVGAFFASARSLQIGDAVPVIAITSAVSNVTAILGGIVVFNDPLGNGPLMITMRIAAFALVVIAAALIPAPVRAAGQRREGSRRRSGEAAPAASTG
jgi:drug/metabolite transporter (DMT)-like permease